MMEAILLFRAVETSDAIRSAVRKWERKFGEGAKVLSGFGNGGRVLWQPMYGVWGHFDKWSFDHDTKHYWNPFGLAPNRFRQNMKVEINPPKKGINRNVQGLIAIAPNGDHWVMHQGRLHPSQTRINEDMFDEASKKKRIDVRFSDGEIVRYHCVANIDLPPSEVQRQTAQFVRECEFVRQYHQFGIEPAEENDRVLAAENALTPEGVGEYEVASQSQRTAVRWHGYVWRALTSRLEGMGIHHSNGRVARYGPDLRTHGGRPVLFELKTQVTASDLQRAVGQLLLYEKLLEKSHVKVIGVPSAPSGAIAKAIRKLGIRILLYSGKGRSVAFDQHALGQLFR